MEWNFKREFRNGKRIGRESKKLERKKMKAHKYNKKYKEQLDLLAHGRGRRDRLETKVVPNKRKKIIEEQRIRDLMNEI
jgi:hypothetical protein